MNLKTNDQANDVDALGICVNFGRKTCPKPEILETRLIKKSQDLNSIKSYLKIEASERRHMFLITTDRSIFFDFVFVCSSRVLLKKSCWC